MADNIIFLEHYGRLAMQRGTVVFFNDDGGYGFIDTGEEDNEDEEDDVYFHVANTDYEDEDLEEGTVVEVDVEETDDGPRAEDLVVVEEDEEE